MIGSLKFLNAKVNQSTESDDGMGAAGRKMWKEITIVDYVYVFIVKKLKDHIENIKYYDKFITIT